MNAFVIIYIMAGVLVLASWLGDIYREHQGNWHSHWSDIVRDSVTHWAPREKTKGNVDAELVLQAMHDYQNYNKAVIVSGDGDFYCLVKYLHEREKIRRLIVPDKYKYSVLLRKSLPRSVGITFLNDLKNRLGYQERE